MKYLIAYALYGFIALSALTSVNLYGACNPLSQEPITNPTDPDIVRGDDKCNEDNDCGPGEYCTPFNYCERCA